MHCASLELTERKKPVHLILWGGGQGAKNWESRKKRRLPERGKIRRAEFCALKRKGGGKAAGTIGDQKTMGIGERRFFCGGESITAWKEVE